MILARSDSAAEAGVCPDDGSARVALEDGDKLFEVGGLGGVPGNVFCEGEIDIVVKNDDEAGFGGEIKDAVEGGIFEAGDFAWDFCGDEFLVNGELTDASEDTGKRLQNTANVIGSVHVCGIEASDHGVDTDLLVFRKRFVSHGYGGVSERVVVEGRIAVEIVGGSAVAVDAIRPFLLEWKAKEGDAAGMSAHHVQKVMNAGTFLNVVGEMTVRIVEFVCGSLRVERNGTTDDVQSRERCKTRDSAYKSAKKAGQFGVLQQFRLAAKHGFAR